MSKVLCSANISQPISYKATSSLIRKNDNAAGVCGNNIQTSHSADRRKMNCCSQCKETNQGTKFTNLVLHIRKMFAVLEHLPP